MSAPCNETRSIGSVFRVLLLIVPLLPWLCSNLVNTAVIAILMACFGQFNFPYDDHSLNIIWRLSYGLGLIPLAFILYWRLFKLKESAVWKGKREALKDIGKASKKEAHRKYGLLLKYYWHRNFGTAMCWFVW